MDIFESKKHIRQLFFEFEQVDKLHHSFMLELENEIYNVINQFFGKTYFNKGVSEALKEFAISIINSTYSVLDKDKHFTNFRMQLELENTAKINLNYLLFDEHSEFVESFKMKLREVVTNFFPDIFELSGDGFRLIVVNFEYNMSSFLMHFFNNFKGND